MLMSEGSSPTIIIPTTVIVGLIFMAALGYGMIYYNRRKTSRLPPSAQYKQSVGAASADASPPTGGSTPESRFVDVLLRRPLPVAEQ